MVSARVQYAGNRQIPGCPIITRFSTIRPILTITVAPGPAKQERCRLNEKPASFSLFEKVLPGGSTGRPRPYLAFHLSSKRQRVCCYGTATSTSVNPINPTSPVWDTAPRYSPSVSPLQLTSTVPVAPIVADVGALSTLKLPPLASGTSQ